MKLPRLLISNCLLLSSLPLMAADPTVGAWHRDPFKIQAGGAPLDMSSDLSLNDFQRKDGGSDFYGHAGPTLIDLSGDGRRDLIVGGFSGRFRYYRNEGTDAAPRFSREYTYLMSGDKPANVKVWCCIAAQANFADLDGKGGLSFVTGSYEPGLIYLFSAVSASKSNPSGTFAPRKVLMEEGGAYPVLGHPEMYDLPSGARMTFSKRALDTVKLGNPYGPQEALEGPNGAKLSKEDSKRKLDGYNTSLWSVAALVDFDNDGKQDLAVGTQKGRIFLVKNVGTQNEPVFSAKRIEVKVNGENAIPEGKAGLAIADWNGDGLFDFVVAGGSGAVYLLQNSGKAGEPQFNTREQLLGRGEYASGKSILGEQWLERGESARRGGAAQVHVADYNRDGKPDLLVGDQAMTITPRSDLTPEEEKKMRAIVAKKDAIVNAKITADKPWYEQWNNISQEEHKQLREIRDELSPYLEKYDTPGGIEDYRTHGFVWVFLHK